MVSAAQLFLVGVRLLAIYFLAAALTSIPTALLSYIAAANSSNMAGSGFSAAGVLGGGLSYSAAGAVVGFLLLRHVAKQSLDTQAVALPGHQAIMVSAIQLLGCYWLIDSSLRVVHIVASGIGVENAIVVRSGDLFGYGVGCLAGWFVIKYAERVAQRLDRITA